MKQEASDEKEVEDELMAEQWVLLFLFIILIQFLQFDFCLNIIIFYYKAIKTRCKKRFRPSSRAFITKTPKQKSNDLEHENEKIQLFKI